MQTTTLSALMAIMSSCTSAALLPHVQSRGVGVAPCSSMLDISCLQCSGPCHTPLGSQALQSMQPTPEVTQSGQLAFSNFRLSTQ